jgi:hypothetical protein
MHSSIISIDRVRCARAGESFAAIRESIFLRVSQLKLSSFGKEIKRLGGEIQKIGREFSRTPLNSGNK